MNPAQPAQQPAQPSTQFPKSGFSQKTWSNRFGTQTLNNFCKTVKPKTRGAKVLSERAGLISVLGPGWARPEGRAGAGLGFTGLGFRG